MVGNLVFPNKRELRIVHGGGLSGSELISEDGRSFGMVGTGQFVLNESLRKGSKFYFELEVSAKTTDKAVLLAGATCGDMDYKVYYYTGSGLSAQGRIIEYEKEVEKESTVIGPQRAFAAAGDVFGMALDTGSSVMQIYYNGTLDGELAPLKLHSLSEYSPVKLIFSGGSGAEQNPWTARLKLLPGELSYPPPEGYRDLYSYYNAGYLFASGDKAVYGMQTKTKRGG